MRKINGKLFLALVAGAVVLTGGTFAVHHFQYKRVGKSLLFQADRAAEKGERREEAKYLQRYLEMNPRDQEATARLARLWAGDAFAPNSKERRAAVGLLDQVLAHKDDPELRLLLVKTALEQMPSDVSRGREHLEQLLSRAKLDTAISSDKAARQAGKQLTGEEAAPDRRRGELEGYWGLVLEDARDPASALHCHRLAVLHAPENQVSYLKLAYLLRREIEPDLKKRAANAKEADRVIDSLVARNPESHEAYLNRWRYRRDFSLLRLRDGDAGPVLLEAAAQDVADAIKRKPESVDVLLAAADLERLRVRLAGESALPAGERRALMKGHRDRAAKHLERGLEVATSNAAAATPYNKFQLMWHKANLLLDDAEVTRMQREEDGLEPTDDAKARADVVALVAQIRRSQVPASADYVEARLRAQEKQWPEAARLFQNARALLNDQPEMACQASLYLGQCYERLEEHQQMYDAYAAVLKHDPNSHQARLGMAQARRLQGQDAESLVLYDGLMRQKLVPARAWFDVARLQMQIQAKADRPNWQPVEAALNEAERHNPRAWADVAVLRSEAAYRRGDAAKGLQLLEAAHVRDPKEPEVHAALIDAHLRGKSADKAKVALDRARREAGDRGAVRLAEARFLATTQGKQAGDAIAALALETDSLPEEERARLLAGVAEVQMRNDDLKRSRETWQALARLPNQRTNLRLRMLLFDLAMRDADEAGMLGLLDDVRKAEQDSGTYHRYGKALYHVWKARRVSPAERDEQLRQASAELDEVARARENWSPVNVARAEIAEVKGAPAQAIQQLRAALANGDDSPATTRKLIVLLEKQNDPEAERLMARLRKSLLAQAELWKLKAAMASRRGQHAEALRLLREMVREDDEDARSLALLADGYAASGDFEKAGRLYDRAVELAGNDPVPYVAKVRFLVDRKKKDEARPVLAALKTNVRGDRADLALGRCLDLVGEGRDAVAAYDRAVKADPDGPETVKAVASAHLAAGRSVRAEELLRQMASGKMSRLDGKDVMEAKRQLALLLAAGTDFRRFAEALELVGVKLDGQGRMLPPGEREEQEDEIRTRARVLSMQNQKQFRAEAIRLFEALRKRNKLTPDDTFVLARLNEIEGQPNRSREDLATLVASTTPNAQHVAYYADLLIGQKTKGSLAEAEKKIGLLEELEKQREVGPNGFKSVELRARLLEARGGDANAAAALKLIRDHAGREGAVAEEVIFVVNALCRQGKFEQAFDLCEETWEKGKCQPEVCGAISAGVVNAWKGATDERVARIEKRIEGALKKNDKSVVLRLHLAQIHDKRGQYDRAADEYRKVIEAQPNNVVALNNLAWMLATRSGDANKALAHVDRAIAGMGRQADLLDTRALVRLAMREPAKAVEDMQEALKDAETPVRLYHLARAHHENREREKAREALTRARSKGLEVATLHPIEREAARKLFEEYR